MSRASDEQVARYAIGAGFRGDRAVKAVAVALGESDGDTDAEGDAALQTATWGPSIGLWQIRSLKAESGKGTPRDATRLRDPAFNARAAYSISKGGADWSPWSVWTQGKALLLIPRAESAVRKAGANPAAGDNPLIPNAIEGPTDAAAGLGPAVEDAISLAKKTALWVADPDNWKRVLEVVLGAALVIAGLAIAAAPATPVAQTVKRAGRLAAVA